LKYIEVVFLMNDQSMKKISFRYILNNFNSCILLPRYLNCLGHHRVNESAR